MANTEMNYVEGGGIYELARVTVTSSMTFRQVLTALITQAGSALTWVANNRLDKLKIKVDNKVVFYANANISNVIFLIAHTGASYINFYTVRLDLSNSSNSTFKSAVNNSMATYSDDSTKTISQVSEASFVGDWVLYYE